MSATRPGDEIRALLFDTGGTVLDWFTGIECALQGHARELGSALQAAEAARAWRRLSVEQVVDILAREPGTASLDMEAVLEETLDPAISAGGGVRPEGEVRAELVRAWSRLPAWPDAGAGLDRLRTRYIVASFTILRTIQVVTASRFAGLTWDCVISCEMIGTYKTHPLSYATALGWLDLAPGEALLVTTHNNDLRAAHACGLKTAFVRRPREWGDQPQPEPVPSPLADFVCEDFKDLATQLGCAALEAGGGKSRLDAI